MPDTTYAEIPRPIRDRRWWLLFLALWVAVVGFSLRLNIADIVEQSRQVAVEGARDMFRMVMLTRNWNAGHGGVYVPVTPKTQPNPYLEHPLRDLTTTGGMKLTMVNPAYMTRLIAEMAELDSGAVFRLTSLKPIRPDNAPDAWERQSLLAFESGATETTTVEPGKAGDVLRYMAPLIVQESCLQCHEQQGYKIGDIRGGISVSQRYAPIEAATRKGIHQTILTHGAVLVFVAAMGWMLLHLLRSRWFDLAGKIRELGLLYEVTTGLAEPGPLEAACKGVLDKVCNLPGVRGGAVRLLSPAANELDVVVSSNLPESLVKAEARLPMGTCLCGTAAIRGVSVTAALSAGQGGASLDHCRQCGFAAVAAIPISAKNRLLGVFTLFFDQASALGAPELRMLEAIGLHLGVVIENLRLVMREKEMAVSEERNLLARELHDSIAQSLAFLNIQAQMLKDSLAKGRLDTAAGELAMMGEGIQESYDNVRELLGHFRIKVEHAELDDAIRSALEKFEGQTGVRTSFRKEGEGGVPAATSTIQVLHIVQEALSNVRKHAGATTVDVVMRSDGEFAIAVRDDGKGFDPARIVEEGGSHVGISIMRERAHRMGARLDVDAAPGRGTCVRLVLPR